MKLLGKTAPVDGDVFRWPTCESVVARTIAELGGIDILVSNPALSRRADFLEFDPETFARVIEGTRTGGSHMGPLVAWRRTCEIGARVSQGYFDR